MLGGVPGEPRAPGSSAAAGPGLAHTRQLPAALLPPAEPPARTSRPAGSRGDVRGGEQRSWRRIQPCEPPASRPAARGCPRAAAELPPEGTPDKARTLPPPAARRDEGPVPAGRGAARMELFGTEQEPDPGPRQTLPGRISALLCDEHVPTWADAVCSVALTAPSTDTSELCRVAGVCPESGGCHLPRDPGSDKGSVAFRNLPEEQEAKRVSSLWLRKTLGRTLIRSQHRDGSNRDQGMTHRNSVSNN